MKALAIVAVLLVAAAATFAQTPTKERRTIVNVNPDPGNIFLGYANVRIQNRAGVGVLVAIDEIPMVENPALRKADGIIDRVVVLLGADPQPEFSGRATVSLRKGPGPDGVMESIVVDPWDSAAAKTFTAYVGLRPTFRTEDARTVAIRGIAEYTGRMVTVPLAQLDTIEFASR
jgi:hypothetical protein